MENNYSELFRKVSNEPWSNKINRLLKLGPAPSFEEKAHVHFLEPMRFFDKTWPSIPDKEFQNELIEAAKKMEERIVKDMSYEKQLQAKLEKVRKQIEAAELHEKTIRDLHKWYEAKEIGSIKHESSNGK